MANLLESILGPAIMAYGLARSSSRNRGNYSGNGLISQMLAKAEKQKEYDQQIAKINRSADLNILADTIARSTQTGAPSIYTEELIKKYPELPSLVTARMMANAQFNNKKTPTIEALVGDGQQVPGVYADSQTIAERNDALMHPDTVNAFNQANLTKAALTNATQPYAVAAARRAGADFSRINEDPGGFLNILGDGASAEGAGQGAPGGGSEPKQWTPKDYANVGKNYSGYISTMFENMGIDISEIRSDASAFQKAVPTLGDGLVMTLAMNGMENTVQNRSRVMANAGVTMGLTPSEIGKTVKAVELYFGNQNAPATNDAPGGGIAEGADTGNLSGLTEAEYIALRSRYGKSHEDIVESLIPGGRAGIGGQNNMALAELAKYRANYENAKK